MKHLPSDLRRHEWTPVSLGESGDEVYRRGDGAMYAKIARGERAALLESERDRIEWLSQTEVSCPRVLDWRESGEAACLVISSVPGVPASDLTPAQLRRAWPSVARLLKLLHDLPVDSCPFERRLETMMALATDVVQRDAINPDFLDPADRHRPANELLAQVTAPLSLRLSQESADLAVCHGDACLPNFMIDPETLCCTGFIDLGRLGKADRYTDFALMLANARESWGSEDDAGFASSELFRIHAITEPDTERLQYYLQLDPLTWG